MVQKLPRQPGVALQVVIAGSRAPIPEELETARKFVLFSPFRAPGSPVEVRPERSGRGIDLFLRVISGSAKRAATRELSQKVSAALGMSPERDSP